jgi:hypothetical protein
MERLEPKVPLACMGWRARLVALHKTRNLYLVILSGRESGDGGGVQREHRRVVVGLVG